MDLWTTANVTKPSVASNRVPRQSARSSSHPHLLLNLQRSIGNQAMQRLIHSPFIQTKLKISTPGDPFEQEADRVADTVMRMEDPGATGKEKDGANKLDASSGLSIQRLCSKCDNEDGHVQRKDTAPLRISKADQSLQRDVLDDITEKLAEAGESLAEGAESAVSTVTSEVGSAVETGVDAVTSAVSTGAQTVGEIVGSVQEELGGVATPVTQAAEPDASANGVHVDWNSPPALELKAWALQHQEIFLDARGKPPSFIFNQIDFPPHILTAAEELAKQSRAEAVAPASTPSPVSGPVSGPVSTGPVSGVRPIPGAARGPAGFGVGGGVFVIGFIIGFVLPFLIGFIIEHSEETSSAPDPDEKSKPGGVDTPIGDAGAPSSKTTPETDPKPDEKDPREEKCRESFRESPSNPTHANPLECDFIPMEQVIEQGLKKPKFMLDDPNRFKFGKPRVSQTVEDADACGGGPGQTFHVPIIDKRTNSPVKDIEVSVFECACCDEEGRLGVRFERPHISGGR